MEIEHSREPGLVDDGAVQQLGQVLGQRRNGDAGHVSYADPRAYSVQRPVWPAGPHLQVATDNGQLLARRKPWRHMRGIHEDATSVLRLLQFEPALCHSQIIDWAPFRLA